MTLHLNNRIISGETIDINKKEATILGSGLVLSGCVLRLRTDARAFTIAECRIEKCSIEAKAKIKNVRWCNAWIEQCTLRGIFTGCDFGTWAPAFDKKGGIKDCDLTEAILDGCRFLGDHTDTLKLPEWPCFAIKAPKQASEKLKMLKWPGNLHLWFSNLDWNPDEVKLLVLWAPSIIKQFGGTESELKKILESEGIMGSDLNY